MQGGRPACAVVSRADSARLMAEPKASPHRANSGEWGRKDELSGSPASRHEDGQAAATSVRLEVASGPAEYEQPMYSQFTGGSASLNSLFGAL